MTLNNTYQVKPTHTFKLELLNIINYIKTSLKQPQIAIFLYNRIIILFCVFVNRKINISKKIYLFPLSNGE